MGLKQSKAGDMQLPGEFRQIICQHSGSPTVLNPFHVSWKALEEGGGSLEQPPRPPGHELEFPVTQFPPVPPPEQKPLQKATI